MVMAARVLSSGWEREMVDGWKSEGRFSQVYVVERENEDQSTGKSRNSDMGHEQNKVPRGTVPYTYLSQKSLCTPPLLTCTSRPGSGSTPLVCLLSPLSEVSRVALTTAVCLLNHHRHD